MDLSSCTSGGCGAKIGPGELKNLLSGLTGAPSDNLLVGFDGSDDAAVYRVGDVLIASTIDFFSPMIADPRAFGRIAAANALSDIYAMGGQPRFALNMVCFPEAMDRAILKEILEGGAEALREAGVALAGGHSIYDREIKYGLAVTGQIEPDRLLRNNTPRVGDALILTKPLGVGVILAAHRVGLADAEHVETAVRSMARLNRDAARAMARYPVSAATDVTGFGLLAHLLEMVADRYTAVLDPDAIPLLPGALHYADQYLLTAAGQRNRDAAIGSVDRGALERLPFALQELLFDPQTSGGLLISAPPDCADRLLGDICATDPSARLIGRIETRGATPLIFQEGTI